MANSLSGQIRETLVDKNNRQMLEKWTKFIKDVGFPIAAFFIMVWMMKTYWLDPSLKHMEVMTSSMSTFARVAEENTKLIRNTNEVVKRIEAKIK